VGRVIVLDANVLIAFSRPDDAHHDAALRLVRDTDDQLATPALTLAEYLVLPARRGVAADAYAALVDELGIRVLDDLGARWPVVLATTRATTGLKMPDAVVLAAAQTVGGRVATFDAALARAAEELGCRYEVG
jgi:uncharacterized protein